MKCVTSWGWRFNVSLMLFQTLVMQKLVAYTKLLFYTFLKYIYPHSAKYSNLIGQQMLCCSLFTLFHLCFGFYPYSLKDLYIYITLHCQNNVFYAYVEWYTHFTIYCLHLRWIWGPVPAPCICPVGVFL